MSGEWRVGSGEGGGVRAEWWGGSGEWGVGSALRRVGYGTRGVCSWTFG